MIDAIITKIFGDPDVKKIAKYSQVVKQINKKHEELSHFTLDDVKTKTQEIQAKFEGLDFTNSEDSEKINSLLEESKIEAMANVKQACILINGQEFTVGSDERKIVWNMIPYDVQFIGALALHDGGISEMKTGEGKTLVGTIPAYLNALTGNPVHIVTVNDYLAQRDSEEMSILYDTLGVSVGVVGHNSNKADKQVAYQKDIVYATNNELGFDYLRDNMVSDIKDKVQSKAFYAIIDEVDSILIDEARTPLIISMPDNEPTSKYAKFSQIAAKLEKGIDYTIDEKQKAAPLTEAGIQKVEGLLHVDNIYVSSHYNDLHHIENAIKAKGVYIKDKDYIVNGEEVMIIDEHTGRALSGRRYSDGLHQAIEAKEGVKIQQESKTLASITFQNYFRTYWKLAGMTGTAKTEEEEFYKVYALDTLVIPTNKPIIRDDRADLLFKNEKGKFEYIVEEIQTIHKTRQPILVGTVSVSKSEFLSAELSKVGIPHTVLNAKHHDQEADIVAKAGQAGGVTIATNMAGRGTDIKLGEGVIELGGLYIIGTEKHETRRIDNQLRGRAGRQGDPGATQFLISPNDDIMRIFGGDKLFGVFNSPMFASLPDNEPLAQSSMLTRKVTGVQKQVEGHNFDSRKHVLEYDDVMNKHREIIYKKRNTILTHDSLHEDIMNMISSQLKKLITAEVNKQDISDDEEIDHVAVIEKINAFLGREAIDTTVEMNDIEAILNIELSEISVSERLHSYISKIALEEIEKLKNNAREVTDFYTLEKKILLQSIDELWMRHIDSMTKLREEVAFEGYAQRQPLVVYKEKAFEKFDILMGDIEYKTTKAMFSINAISKVDEIKIQDSDITINTAQLEELQKQLENAQREVTQKKNNPLFAQVPSQDTKSSTNKSSGKQKIRV